MSVYFVILIDSNSIHLDRWISSVCVNMNQKLSHPGLIKWSILICSISCFIIPLNFSLSIYMNCSYIVWQGIRCIPGNHLTSFDLGAWHCTSYNGLLEMWVGYIELNTFFHSNTEGIAMKVVGCLNWIRGKIHDSSQDTYCEF